MPHTKHNNPCLVKAADDEPIFVLRAQDISAPLIVAWWLQHNPQISQEKHDDALECIRMMEEWPKRRPAN